MSRRKQIGVVGVDSGQLMLTDPCYIASEWDPDDHFIDDRIYVNAEGREVKFGKDFTSYEQKIEPYGKTMNQLLKEKVFKKVEKEPSGKFGYGGACQATLSPDRGGQLNYKLGHAGAGVAVSTGYGDGCYPVIAEYTKDGRVKSVTVQFIED